MLLSHNEITRLLDEGIVTNWRPGAVNAASLDIHLGRYLLVEQELCRGHDPYPVDYAKRDALNMNRVDLMEVEQFVLQPGQFILAQSEEVFNLPLDVSAEYKLKSSMARIGLEHMNAGWCDAGWHGSVLTLEFKNMTNGHSILLRPGDAVGQMVFFCHVPVGFDQSYASRGRYNQDKQVSGIKP